MSSHDEPPRRPPSFPPQPLGFYFGLTGTLAPFGLFLAGVVTLGLVGAPEERGFWPVLLAALTLGLVLARDRLTYCDVVVQGMSRPIVLLMILAWLLAGVLGTLLRASGFVDALVWSAAELGVSGRGFVVAAFVIACAVSTSIGTSLGTLILTVPLLYPAGGPLGADPAVLLGAIYGGATFGDNVSPVSDTTIASSATQGADLGGVVANRMRYALPAAFLALVAYAWAGGSPGAASAAEVGGDPGALPMLLAPALTFVLLLRRRHLVEGLLFGILAATVIGLLTGRLEPAALFYIDRESFGARGLIVDGINGGVGASIFTFFLMGLVAAVEATGLLDRLVGFVERRARTVRAAESAILAATAIASALITHSTVVILALGELTRKTGERLAIGPYRRANLLDVTVCTFPYLLPYCIPAILAASLTGGAEASGMPRLSPFDAGLMNFHSWALLVVITLAVATGWGASRPGATAPAESDGA